MKKVLSLVLVLTLVLGSFSFAFAAPASDVVGTEYEDAVNRLGQLGVLTGYEDGTFKPQNTITRAEFAAVVVRAKGLDSAAQAAKGTTVFTDVPATSWASGYVNIASKMGYVKGMGDGTFAPNSPVTYEQAVTMVIRALGYEPAAEARGGYPYGYLIIANQEGLLDAVKGTQGLPAPRGLVAQLVDNALEIPLMIQVGYGAQTKWVKSGTEDTDEIFLLDELGFTKITKERVVSFDSTRNEIRFADHGKAKVASGFDFEEVYGLRLNAWVDGANKVVVFTKADTPRFDATSGGSKITLVKENKAYVVAEKATLLLNGEEVKAASFTADYAKVVLNADDEIVWARGYTFDDTFVAKKTGEDVIYSFDNDDLVVKNYKIVKEGKTISLDDVEEGDLVFFNKANKYAVIYNDSQAGEIERVYTDSFKFDGEVYTYDAGNYDVKFVDEDVVGVVDKDIMASMKDEGNVEVFFDFAGNAVLVLGDRGEVKTSYYYAILVNNSAVEGTGSRQYISFDILNDSGKIAKHDLTLSFADKYDGTADGNRATWLADMKAKSVVKVTVDEDGDIVKVAKLTSPTAITDVKVDASYAAGYRLQDDTVVFLALGEASVEDYDVVKWSEANKKLSEVDTGFVYASDKGRAAVIIADTATVNTETYRGLVTDVRKLRTTGDVWEVTMQIAGEEKVYVTDGTETASSALEDKIVEIDLTDAGKISAIRVEPNVVSNLKVTTVSTSAGTITVGGSVYELVDDAVVYDATGTSVKKITLRDLNENETIKVFMLDGSTTRFVNYVVKTAKAPTTPVSDYSLAINSAKTELTVTLKSGDNEANFAVLIGDEALPITSGKVNVSGLAGSKIYTARLVKLTDLNNELATETFLK